MMLKPACTRFSFLSFHGCLGLMLIGVAWPASWLQLEPLAEYSFFPLWLGYILAIDALVLRREGKQVSAEGRLSSRTYQTQSGETRHSLDINVQDVQFLRQRGDGGGQNQGPAPEEYREVKADGDLPF